MDAKQIWNNQVVEIAEIWEVKGALTTSEMQKLVLAEIKQFDEDSFNDVSLKTRTQWMFIVTGLIEKLTPRQFCQIIPIEKDFRGHKYGCRDYFSAKKFIEDEIGWDSKIPNGFQFLMEFWSDDVFDLSAWMMTVVSDNQQRWSGKSTFEIFAEKKGIKLHTLSDFMN